MITCIKCIYDASTSQVRTPAEAVDASYAVFGGMRENKVLQMPSPNTNASHVMFIKAVIILPWHRESIALVDSGCNLK